MSVPTLCPKCDKWFTPPNNARADFAPCPECGHLFEVAPIKAIAPGAPAAYDPGSPETTIQTEPFRVTASRSEWRLEADSVPEPNVERGFGSILASLGLRFNSPVSWLGALVLFFLPWVEIRCDRQVNTYSGAHLAWLYTKGSYKVATEQLPEEEPPDPSFVWRVIAVALMLSLYPLLLLGGLTFACARPASRRAAIGACYALCLLCLLLASTWILWEIPVGLGANRFLPALYLSHTANLWALASFGMEYLWMRKCRRTSVE